MLSRTLGVGSNRRFANFEVPMQIYQGQTNRFASPKAPLESNDVLERHYTVLELSSLWGFSDRTIRRLFDTEPGVIKIDRPETTRKRRYTSIRIPTRVAQRVYQRLQA
jgi:hypothetical protein